MYLSQVSASASQRKRVIVLDARSEARRKSALRIFLSTRNFHNPLYEIAMLSGLRL